MAMNWSFRARLLNASETMKNRYRSVCGELSSYVGIKTSQSWDKTRIYSGRKTLGAMLFRGKTLCVALALDPAKYAETKYVFSDIGQTAKYASTPMLVRLTSERQVKYLKELFGVLFGEAERKEPEQIAEIPFADAEELAKQGLIKITAGNRRKAVDEVEEVEEQTEQTVASVAESTPCSYAETLSRPKGIVNLGVLNANFEQNEVVTPQILKDKGLLCGCVNCLKVLADGILTKKLTVVANGFSACAKREILRLGGKIVELKTKN